MKTVKIMNRIIFALSMTYAAAVHAGTSTWTHSRDFMPKNPLVDDVAAFVATGGQAVSPLLSLTLQRYAEGADPRELFYDFDDQEIQMVLEMAQLGRY